MEIYLDRSTEESKELHDQDLPDETLDEIKLETEQSLVVQDADIFQSETIKNLSPKMMIESELIKEDPDVESADLFKAEEIDSEQKEKKNSVQEGPEKKSSAGPELEKNVPHR